MFERKVIISQSQGVHLNTSSWTATSEGTQKNSAAQSAFSDSNNDTLFPSQDTGRVLKNTIGRWTSWFPLLVPLSCLCRLQSTKVRLYTHEERHITLSPRAVWEIIQSDFGLPIIPELDINQLILKADLPWSIFYSYTEAYIFPPTHPINFTS